MSVVIPPTAQGMKTYQGRFPLLPALKQESQTQENFIGEDA